MSRLVLGQLLFVVAGCIPGGGATEISRRSFVVSTDLTVEETIVRHDTLHDPVIERRYVLVRGGERHELGSFEDESMEGIEHAPRLVGGALVVMSASHVAVLTRPSGTGPASRVRWFMPYEVRCFSEHAEINGHYDIAASDVSIAGTDWRITYTPRPHAAERGPREVVFRSRDGGASFSWDTCPAPVAPRR